LFVDIRHFTTMTETRLPFDFVFLLNRYFAIIGKAVEQSGGRVSVIVVKWRISTKSTAISRSRPGLVSLLLAGRAAS
ncbi:hypothetical protein ACC740_39145, partial [Rhizobium ruizarguesonis]